MTTIDLFTHFSDAEIIDEVGRLARAERQATARLIAALAELDARRLYLAQGCSSLFVYCTRVLHLSEHAAYGRIEAARAARKFPILLEMLAAGDLTLTAVGLLAPHLTDDNCRDVLVRAKHRTKREVEEMVAALRPLPDAKPLVRKLPAPAPAKPSIEDRVAPGGDQPTVATSPATTAEQPPVTRIPTPAQERPVVKPLAPERYKVQMTVSRETIDVLRHVQDLMRHVVPDGDPAVIFHRALKLLETDLEKRRFAAVAKPRASEGVDDESRYISAAVRRTVWTRDGGRCTFVGVHGRCTETGMLEFHHRQPFSTGGESTVENLELRCRAHNQYEADLFSGVLIARERREGFGVDPGPGRSGQLGLDRAPGRSSAITG